MTEPPPPADDHTAASPADTPALTPRAAADLAARRAREATALRDNLRRRKQQSRKQQSCKSGGSAEPGEAG